MTATTQLNARSAVQPYLDQLEEKVAHLPPEQRAEMRDDLQSHLNEILGDDPDASLADRVGSPESYVTELVSSLGLDQRRGQSRVLKRLAPAITDRLARLGQRVSWLEMRWALWTLRGTATGLFLAWGGLFADHHDWLFRIPAIGLITAATWGSVRVGSLGRNSTNWRHLSWVLTVIGLIAFVSLATNLSARMTPY